MSEEEKEIDLAEGDDFEEVSIFLDEETIKKNTLYATMEE